MGEGRSSSAPNPAAAEHAVAVIEHRGLAWRDRAGPVSEHEFGLAGSTGKESRRYRRLRRAQLCGDCDRLARIEPRPEPIDFAQPHPGFGERGVRTDDDPAPCRIEAQHVKRFGCGDADALALAD